MTIVRTLMQGMTLLLPLSAALVTHCGGEVRLENRPCPCSADWTCCSNLICVPNGTECPRPPPAYCLAGWTETATSCVYSADVKDADVCRFADSPMVQEDIMGDLDWCAPDNSVLSLHRVMVCANFFGTTVMGMTVDLAEQLVQPGRDRCVLHASLLIRAASPPP